MPSYYQSGTIFPRDAVRAAILSSASGTQKQALKEYRDLLEIYAQEDVQPFELEDIEAVIVLDQFRDKTVPHRKNGDVVIPQAVVSDTRKKLKLQADIVLPKANSEGIRARDPKAGLFVAGFIDGNPVGERIPIECRFEPFSYANPYGPEATATVWISPNAYLDANRDALEKAGFHIDRAKEDYFRAFLERGARVDHCNFPLEDLEKFLFPLRKEAARAKWRDRDDDILER